MTLKATSAKKYLSLMLLVMFLLPPGMAWSTPSSDFLFSLGLDYYRQGLFDDALLEFNKCLLVDPEHPEAAVYIDKIKEHIGLSRRDPVTVALDEAEAVLRIGGREGSGFFERAPSEAVPERAERPAPPAHRGEAVAEAGPRPALSDHVKVGGVYQVAMGARSNGAGQTEFIWKDANADLNERNYRILFGASRHNTYDPGIYSRLSVDMDTKDLSPAGLGTIGAQLRKALGTT